MYVRFSQSGEYVQDVSLQKSMERWMKRIDGDIKDI